MKLNDKIFLTLILLALTIAPIAVYAGGPGFDTDVYTWGSDDDDGGDDDGHCDDDDHGGGGDDDGDDDGGGDDDDGNEIPLDGGMSILAAAGGAYVIKRYKDSKSNKKK